MAKLLLVICLFLLVNPAKALLIDAGAITIDSDTGLEWLDIDQSLGFSWLDVENGLGGFTAAGWRHATLPEVCGLFVTGGVSPPTCPGGFSTHLPTGNQLQAFNQFLPLIGYVFVSNVGYPYLITYGVYSDSDGAANGVGVAAARITPQPDGWPPVVGSSVQNDAATLSTPILLFTTFSPTAHWLVRSVPEPHASVLLAVGLTLVFGRRRR